MSGKYVSIVFDQIFVGTYEKWIYSPPINHLKYRNSILSQLMTEKMDCLYLKVNSVLFEMYRN